MPQYSYKAVSAIGQMLEGQMEARDQAAVVERLHATGSLPVRVEPVRAGAPGGLLAQLWRPARSVSQKEVGVVTQELATLVRAGLPLDRALEIMIGIAENERVERVLASIQEDVRGGSALAAALEAQGGAFSRLYISMIRAGEAGGALDTVLDRLAEYLERAKALKDSVLSALIYPTILLLVAVASVVLLLVKVIPSFAQMFKDMGAALPLPTQIVMAAGEFLTGYWWALLLAVAAVVIIMRRQLSHPAKRRRWDRRLLRWPLVGDLVAKVEVARFSRTLGTLVGNGVPLLTALSIVRETLGNQIMMEEVATAAEGLKSGRGLAEPLAAAGVFPPLAVHMIRVGEETGRLEEMLLQVANTYDREVQTAVKRLLAILEPVLILGLAVIIAGIIMSVLVAILGVNDLAV